MRLSGKLVSKKTEKYIKQLYAKKDADRMIRKIGNKRAAVSLCIVLATVFVSLPVFVTEYESSQKPVDKLTRNGYGEGDETVALRAVTDDGTSETLTVAVREREYNDRELDELSKRLDEELWDLILAANTDADNVTSDLDLVKSVEGYPFEITWKSDRQLLLSGSGKVNTDRLIAEDPDDAGIGVRLCATLKYRNYTEDKYSYVILHSYKDREEKSARELIEKAVKESDEESAASGEMILPDSIGNRRLRFYKSTVNKGWAVVLIGLIASALYIAAWDERIKKEAEGRRRQMEMDYPNILNQYMLYYLAGMNPRTIWYSMCERYESGREEKRYIFEEMITTRNRMDEGLGELAAYDDFAARCDNIRIRSFIGFVKQAVVKGSGGLDRLLYEEMDRARRERINLVKIEASEASTKLLLPMFMMLIVVLAIVMIPAFIGLNG